MLINSISLTFGVIDGTIHIIKDILKHKYQNLIVLWILFRILKKTSIVQALLPKEHSKRSTNKPINSDIVMTSISSDFQLETYKFQKKSGGVCY